MSNCGLEFRCWLGLEVGDRCEQVAVRLLESMQDKHPDAGPAVSHGSGRATLVFGLAAADVPRALMTAWQIASVALGGADADARHVVRFEMERVLGGAYEPLRVKLDYYADDYPAIARGGRASHPGVFVATLPGRDSSGAGAAVSEAIERLAAKLVAALEDGGSALESVADGDDELDAAIARHVLAGDLVATLIASADEPVLADEPSLRRHAPPESTGALEVHVLELLCPSCGAVYEAVGATEDLTALSCWFCPSLLSETLAGERHVASEREPAPGRPVLTLLSRSES